MNIKHAPCLARIVANGDMHDNWIVRVIEYINPDELYSDPDGQRRIHDFPSGGWNCESLMHSMFDGTDRYAVINDMALRPLPGDELPESSDTTRELEAV